MSGETGIKELCSIIQNETYVPLAEVRGFIGKRESMADAAAGCYLDEAGNPEIKEFSIVIDTANAVGAPDYEALFKRIPGKITRMNFALDGTFPSHEADPLKLENTEDLQKRVLEVGAGLGIAADGDSDRIFIIDEKGNRVPPPILYTIIAKAELKQHPGAALAYEIRLGMLVRDEFEYKGVKMIPTPVGHSLEKQIMLDSGAIFGGEISGHYFFKFPFGTFEAPGLLVIKLLAYLTAQSRPLSEIAGEYNRYFSSGEVNTNIASREFINQKIDFIKSKYEDGEQILLDGLKVVYNNWWFSIRASNTEPVVRLIVEANTEELMEQKRAELLGIIRGD